MIKAINIINQTIAKLNIDLSGYTILTEVGSNNYLYTPIIASLCGAKKVYALAKDNNYGKASNTIQKAILLSNELGINNIEFLKNTVPDNIYPTIDILTNSGNLRPINGKIINYLKSTAVIPLMFELWEIRNEDIDINYCKVKNIKVAGTWENHPDIKVFDYSGMLAVKMILDSGNEVTGNKIIVWSSDHFGEVISKKLKEENADVILTTDTTIFYENLANADIVFLTDYHEKRNFFGVEGIFNIDKIKSINNDIMFVHLYGKIDFDFCKLNKLNISPKKNGKANVMTHTLGYVGLNPILKLQVAGFRVAQEMLEEKYSDLSQKII